MFSSYSLCKRKIQRKKGMVTLLGLGKMTWIFRKPPVVQPETDTMIKPIVFRAPKTPNAAVIFLHGLGDTGHGWATLPTIMHQRSEFQHIDFVLPNAPMRYISMYGQMAPGWFDLTSLNANALQDAKGTMRSLEMVEDVVAEVVSQGIPHERIVIGGFSQGGALAEAAALLFTDKYAGFLPVSGFLSIRDKIDKITDPVNKDTPMLFLHGTADDVVSLDSGVRSRQVFEDKFKFSHIEHREYPGVGHTLPPEGIDDIASFLKKVVPSQ